MFSVLNFLGEKIGVAFNGLWHPADTTTVNGAVAKVDPTGSSVSPLVVTKKEAVVGGVLILAALGLLIMSNKGK